MVGIAAVVAIAAVVVGGVAAVVATSISADAQRDVAATNAKATVDAAKEAAEAQKYSAQQDATARMHDSDIQLQRDRDYLKQEKELAVLDNANKSYFNEMQQSVDTIDQYYAGTGSLGSGAESPYDYGGESVHGDTVDYRG